MLKFNPPFPISLNSCSILWIHSRFSSNMFLFISITIPTSATPASEPHNRAYPSSTKSPYMHKLNFENIPRITSKFVTNALVGVIKMSDVLVAISSLLDANKEYRPVVSSRFLKKISKFLIGSLWVIEVNFPYSYLFNLGIRMRVTLTGLPKSISSVAFSWEA